jgi:hypothetical protein
MVGQLARRPSLTTVVLPRSERDILCSTSSSSVHGRRDAHATTKNRKKRQQIRGNLVIGRQKPPSSQQFPPAAAFNGRLFTLTGIRRHVPPAAHQTPGRSINSSARI